MLRFVIVLVLSFAFFGSSQENIGKEFRNSEIIPNVIDDPPNYILVVNYDSDVDVGLGNVVPSKKIRKQPTVDWMPEEDTLYTLIVTNPDVPTSTNHSLSEFCHWLVVNIPGNDVQKGETLKAYTGMVPVKFSGVRRHVFLLYKQSDKLDTSKELHVRSSDITSRFVFSTRGFAYKFELEGPIAGNYFLSHGFPNLKEAVKK